MDVDIEFTMVSVYEQLSNRCILAGVDVNGNVWTLQYNHGTPEERWKRTPTIGELYEEDNNE